MGEWEGKLDGRKRPWSIEKSEKQKKRNCRARNESDRIQLIRDLLWV